MGRVLLGLVLRPSRVKLPRDDHDRVYRASLIALIVLGLGGFIHHGISPTRKLVPSPDGRYTAIMDGTPPFSKFLFPIGYTGHLYVRDNTTGSQVQVTEYTECDGDNQASDNGQDQLFDFSPLHTEGVWWRQDSHRFAFLFSRTPGVYDCNGFYEIEPKAFHVYRVNDEVKPWATDLLREKIRTGTPHQRAIAQYILSAHEDEVASSQEDERQMARWEAEGKAQETAQRRLLKSRAKSKRHIHH